MTKAAGLADGPGESDVAKAQLPRLSDTQDAVVHDESVDRSVSRSTAMAAVYSIAADCQHRFETIAFPPV